MVVAVVCVLVVVAEGRRWTDDGRSDLHMGVGGKRMAAGNMKT